MTKDGVYALQNNKGEFFYDGIILWFGTEMTWLFVV